jgi:hypothetical protein
MKTIIAGGRDITDYQLVVDAIAASGFNITEVVSGKAQGVDSLGERYAKERTIPVIECPAQWDRFGKMAGPFRNRQMAQQAEALVLVWDGRSKGSRNMLKQAQEFGLKIYEKRI